MSRRLGTALLGTALVAAAFGPPSVLTAQSSEGDTPFAGSWHGVLDAGAAKLRLVFHVTTAPDGTLAGTLDSPDQGARGIPASGVSAEGRNLTFVLAALGARFEGTLAEGDTALVGTFAQAGATFPLTLRREEAGAVAAPPRRPQIPAPPYPYREEETSVSNPEAGVTLAGTLTLPSGPGPHPAVVLVSGSGPQDRDETLLGHKPFLVLADHLARQGIAVLRYDDRGVAGSTGTFSTATTLDFASDALAAVAHLRARPDIGAVGIVGHSEGGLVAPLAATRSDGVDFIVLLAGPGLTGAEIVLAQSALISRAAGTPPEVVEFNTRTRRAAFEAVRTHQDTAEAARAVRSVIEASIEELPAEVRSALAARSTPEAIEAQVRSVNTPWFRFFLDHDPRPVLEDVRIPVLALLGSLDLQVPAEDNAREIEAALHRGGNPDATVRILPGLNHLFQTAETGAPTEYEQIEETMSPVALEAVSGWIRARFAGRDGTDPA